MLFGIEPYIVLNDTSDASNRKVDEITRRMADAPVGAAQRAARRSPPPKA